MMLWEFWKNDTDLFPSNIKKNISNPSLKDKPHCVVFVFDGSMDEIPNGEEETKFYKDIIQMARDRKYFYPQVVLTCQDKILKELLEEDSEGEGEQRLSSLNHSVENANAQIQTDDITVKIKEESKENKALSQSIRQRFN